MARSLSIFLILSILFLNGNLAFAKLHNKQLAAAVIPQPAEATGEGGLKQQVEKRSPGKIRLALTLAGGGSRGAAHIGVLKVFDREGIRPDFIAGSSIGGLIGCLYAAGMPAVEIEKVAVNGKLKHAFFPIPRTLQTLLYVPRYSLQRLLFMKPKIGLYSGNSISKFVRNTVPHGITDFKDLKIPLAVTALNLIDTKPVWITEGNLARAMQASCTLPFMYRPVGKDAQLLIDGGIRANLPTKLAEAVGAPVVVAVKLHSYLEKTPRKSFDTPLDYADRLTSILMSEIEGKAIADADVFIEPKVQYMNIHTFDKDEILQAIAAGEEAANAAMPEIRRQLTAERTAGTESGLH